MNKIKLLIVSESLAQGGSEKWIYEICKAINRDKFEIAILTDKDYSLTENSFNFKNYHYHKIKELGIKVYELLEFYKKSGIINFTFYRARRLIRYLFGKTKQKINKDVQSLLKECDVICLIDYYNYITLKEIIHDYTFFVVLHSHKFQFDFDPYMIFYKDKSYNFTYFCQKQIEEIGTSNIEINKSKFFFNPLVSDLSACEYIFNPISNKPIVISIFTRIASTKSIDSFIKAFKQIQERISHKVVLNIYGEVIDSKYYESLKQLITTLNVENDSVRFMGHTQNMADSIKTDKVNIYWGITINSSCGYSSIEIGAMGVPSFFWNVDPETDYRDILEQTNNIIHTHNNLDDFVESNLKYVTSNSLLKELSLRQREFFINRHNISDRVKDFENYVISLKESVQ